MKTIKMNQKRIIISVSLAVLVLLSFLFYKYNNYKSFKIEVMQESYVLNRIVNRYMHFNGELPINEYALNRFIKEDSGTKEMFNIDYEPILHKMKLGFIIDSTIDVVGVFRYKNVPKSLQECVSIDDYSFFDYLFSRTILITAEATPCLCDYLPNNNITILKEKGMVYKSNKTVFSIDSIKHDFFFRHFIDNPFVTSDFDTITSFYFRVKLMENGFNYTQICTRQDDFFIDIYAGKTEFVNELADSLAILINPILKRNNIDEAYIPVTFFGNTFRMK